MHTINITIPTAPVRRKTVGRKSLLTWFLKGVTLGLKELRRLSPSYGSWARRVALASAASGVAPDRSRPNRAIVSPHRLVSSLSGKGATKSIRVPGAKTVAKSKEAGSTPTTVPGASFRVRLRPMTLGSEPNRRTQNPWVKRIAAGPLY